MYIHNLSTCILQPRLSEHAGTRRNVRIIESLDNRGRLYINAFMHGPRKSVRIIKILDNRGFTVSIYYIHIIL